MKPIEAAQKAMEEFSKHVRSMSPEDYLQACEELASMAESEYEAAKEQNSE